MVKFVLIFQVGFFLVAGTQIVEREAQYAKAQAVSSVFLSLPVSVLTEVKI